VDSAPAVGLGRIYVGSEDGNLYALNLQGVLVWKFHTNSPITTSPAIGSDGTIYVAGCLRCPFPSPAGGPEGVLYAISPDGRMIWNLTLANFQGYDSLSSPTIGPDGTIYTSDVGFRVVAVHPDGTLKWELLTNGEVFDSPAIAPDGTVYVGIDDPDSQGVCLSQCFVALDSNGAVKWGLPIYGGGFSSPAVGSDGTVYVRGLAIDSNGTLKWQDRPFSSPSIGSDGTIYGSGSEGDIYGSIGGGLYALTPDGTLKWHFPLNSSGGSCSPTGGCSYFSVQESSVAIGSNGLLYVGVGVTNLPSVGNATGSVYAVSRNGTLVWKFGVGSIPGLCGPGYCQGLFLVSDPAIGWDGTVYVGSTDGNLYAID
jgi:large repetitive protein